MPKYQPINLIGGFYTDDSLSWSAQDTVNWLPLAAEVEGTRTVTKLRSGAGFSRLSVSGRYAFLESHFVVGLFLWVSGASLYEVNTSGVETNRGAIPGVGRVSMAHNQITFGNQLTIVNGDSGYVWNTVTNTLTKITDPGFEGSIQVDFLNGFMIHLDPFGRFWFHSQPADALSFNTLDRYTSESSPDNMVGVKVFQSEVVVFNDSTIDFFGLTGSGELGGVFERKNIVINRGCASRNSIARVNNTLAWLGDDGSVYVLNGYREQKISTIPIEQAIAGFNWSQAFAEVWEDQGHTIYYLTFPDGRTWGYDFNSGLWTRRESYELNRWRMSSITFWNGKWIVGDFQSGKLYELKWDFFTENGRPLVSYRATGYSHSDQNRVLCPYLELMFDTGWSPNPSDLEPLLITGDAPDTLSLTPYSYTYSATGGFGIYTFSITAGSLPPGITLSPDGMLSGSASTPGVYNFTVTVTDSLGNTASVVDSISATFTSNAIIAESANNLEIRSGGNNTFPLLQTLITPNITTGSCVITSSDGTFLAFTQNAAERIALYKRNSLGSYILVPAAFDVQPSAVRQIDMTSDGLYLAVVDGTQLRIYKRNTTTDVYATIHTQTDVNFGVDLKWSPNGRYLAVAASLGHVLLRTGDTFSEISNPSGNVVARGFAWNPSSTAYVQKSNGALRVYSVTDTLVSQLTSISETGIGRCRWTRDESTVFVSSNTASPAGIFLRIYSWNGTTLTRLADPVQLPAPAVSIENIDLSSDGRVLMVGAAAGLAIVGFYAVSGSTLSLIPGTTPVINGMFNRFAVSSDHWGQ